jgi:hypothetical protein
MDLAQHAAVLWRFRAVVAGGLVLGVVLAVLAAYEVPSFEQRGSETWSSDSSLLVTQQGFPEGRSTLPATPAPGVDQTGTLSGAGPSGGNLEFADPARLSELASLYAQIATSDRVRARLPGNPKPAQIEGAPVETGSATKLPVIRLTTFAATAEAARRLNRNTVVALQRVLTDEQTRNDIPARQRVQLSQLNAPAAPVKTQGRSHTASTIAFLLCLLGAVALAHLLAAVRDRQEEEAAIEGVVVPWSVGDGDAARAEPEPEPVQSAAGTYAAPAASAPEPAPSRWLSRRRAR